MVPGTFADVSNPLVQITYNSYESEPVIEFVRDEDDENKWAVVNNGVAEFISLADSRPYQNAVEEYINSTYDLTPYDSIVDAGYVYFETLPTEWTEI